MFETGKCSATQKAEENSESLIPEILTDIERFSERTDELQTAESILKELEARRRLMNFLHKKYVVK
jgi:hypothetical protein